MFKVVKKKKPKHLFMDWSEIKYEKIILINLNRYLIYRVVVKHLA